MRKRQGSGITIRESQLVTIVMFNLMAILVSLISFSVDSAMLPITVNVWDTSIKELVRIIVYNHLPKGNLSLKARL